MNRISLPRRKFLSSMAASALVAGVAPFAKAGDSRFVETEEAAEMRVEPSGATGRTYRILGVPLRTGSLYPGSENDAQAYRDVQLLQQLRANGCSAMDEGDVAIPSYLPHHTIPPVRSWPGPRIAWDYVCNRVTPFLREEGQIPLLIGCDCSIVVGTAHALGQARKGDVHVLYVDGDFDDAAPDPARCQSAAALAVWLLTHPSVFWNGPLLRNSQVTVIGWSRAAQSEHSDMGSVSLAELRSAGPGQAARRALAAIPASASILLHLDIDVFRQQEIPAAYFPHPEGMTVSEGEDLLRVLLEDKRISLIEVSEYASLRDQDQSCVKKLVGLLCAGLKE